MISVSTKGQVFSTDFLISAFVFIVLLNIAAFTYNLAYEQQSRLDRQRVMDRKAFNIASLMVRTPGYPSNWTNETVRIVGLSEPDHVVQDAKVQELKEMTPAERERVMDLDASEFFLNISAGSYAETAGAPPSDADTVVVDRRSVIVNATNLLDRGTLTVILWR